MSIQVHSWAPAEPFKNICQFIWTGTNVEAKQEAERVLSELIKRPEGQRVLFFWNPFPSPDNTPDGLMEHVANGFHFDPNFYEDFFWHLHNLKAPKIDRIVLDYEAGISCWGNIAPMSEPVRLAFLQQFYGDASVVAKMNAEMRALTPEDFAYGPNWTKAMQVWNFWLNPQLTSAMKTALVDPIVYSLGYTPKISNYGDTHPSYPIYDLNGWLIQDIGMSSESAPALYLAEGGNRRSSGMKGSRWNSFLDALNYTRSCLVKGDFVPWVSYPSYGGDNLPPVKPWLWIELIHHLAAAGVSEVIYWNPIVAGLDNLEATASAIFCQVQVGLTKLLLPEIPFDAESVTTGSVTTSFDQFEKFG